MLALFALGPAFAASPLTYSTYLPGITGNAIAVDSSGNAYVGVTGSILKLNPSGTQVLATYSLSNVVIYALAFDSAGNLVAGGESELTAAPFLAKFSASGQALFSTVPVALDWVSAVALDSGGNIYVTGPTTVKTGFSNTAVDKFSPSGTPIYSYAFGGSLMDHPRAIAVDAAGEAWVAGDTNSTDFPVTANAAQPKFAGGASEPGYGSFGDAFLAKLDSSGAKLLYCTYWGGAAPDIAYSLALDSAGNAYIAGGTSSADFPVTPGAFQTSYSGPAADPTAPTPAGDAFVSKFSPAGVPVWSTFWGGASADVAYALALDSTNNIYFAGTTESFSDFPRAGSVIPSCRQTGGPFVAVLDPTGSKLLHSTTLPGIGYDNAYALALDSSGAAYITGEAASEIFFTTSGAAQTDYPGSYSQYPYTPFAARIDFTQAIGMFAACVLNGASFGAGNTLFFADGAVAPGEIVSIFGSYLGPNSPQGLQLTNAGLVSTYLAGVTVTFDGIPAPLLYVTASQINAVVPYELANPTTQMTVTYNGQSYGPITLPVAAAVPGIFTATESGSGQAAVINQDGTLNSISNPAARGSVITFYVEGAGAMSPSVPDGTVTGDSNFPMPAQSVAVSIRGVSAAVQYAGAAPGYVSGLLQVNAVVPTSIDFGNLVPLRLNIGSFSSQLNVTIALR